MKKIILSNFLETRENYELFKEKIAHLNLDEDIDSFLFNDKLTKPEKISHIIHEFFEVGSTLKDIIESLDYSITEKQMLIFCYKSTDRDDLLKLLKVDLLADLVNYKWSEEKIETADSDSDSDNDINDPIYVDLRHYLLDSDTDLDFWIDENNEVIYFVFGDALISYSNETGGFSVMRISTYSNLKDLINTLSLDRQPIVNQNFTNEFLANVDTSEHDDYNNIGEFVESYLNGGKTLWSDSEEDIFNRPEVLKHKISEDEETTINGLITETCEWYGYANAFLAKWYDVDEDINGILSEKYPWKLSFDDYLAEIIQTLNEEVTFIDSFDFKYWEIKNRTLNKIADDDEKLILNQTVLNFVNATRKYSNYIKTFSTNNITNPTLVELCDMINITITDNSVEEYLKYLEENVEQNKFD